VLWPNETQSPGNSAAACSPPKGANCPKCLYLEHKIYFKLYPIQMRNNNRLKWNKLEAKPEGVKEVVTRFSDTKGTLRMLMTFFHFVKTLCQVVTLLRCNLMINQASTNKIISSQKMEKDKYKKFNKTDAYCFGDMMICEA
jgi:hypothetical protein